MPENNEIYSTAQAAEMLGCSQEVVRSKKSRHKDKFQEGIHFLKGDGNATLWTNNGIESLRELVSNNDVTSNGNENVTSNGNDIVTVGCNDTVTPSSNNDATNDSNTQSVTQEILGGLLDETGKALALEFYRQLPNATMKHIRRIGSNPTAQEREVIRSAIRPVPAATLLNGVTELELLMRGA